MFLRTVLYPPDDDAFAQAVLRAIGRNPPDLLVPGWLDAAEAKLRTEYPLARLVLEPTPDEDVMHAHRDGLTAGRR